MLQLSPPFFPGSMEMNALSNPPRIAVGGVVHETHTFAQPRTDLSQFHDEALFEGATLLQWAGGTRSAVAGFQDAARAVGWSLQPLLYASAPPGGTVTSAAFDTILARLVARLKAALPLDGIVLALHGAMVTDESLDAESTILERIRTVVGPDVPIVVELDMHGNIAPRTVELADVLVAFDTNPHIDAYERAQEAVDLLRRLIARQIRPTAALVQPPLILVPQATGTDALPLRAVHQRAAELRADPRVLSICIMGGFAYADTPWTGPSVIVTTDDDLPQAQALATELARLLEAQSRVALPFFLPALDAVALALREPRGPVILTDSADNVGGGAPGDGTDALRAMLELGASGALVINDSVAVQACVAAGEGSRVTLSVGGKTDRLHGEPVTLHGVVRHLSDGSFPYELANNHHATFGGGRVEMGPSAWLRAGGIELLLTSRKTAPFDLAQLRGMGIVPEAQQMIVVKSAVAYHAAYGPIATRVIEMSTRGLCPPALDQFSYRHLRRPVWPLDQA